MHNRSEGGDALWCLFRSRVRMKRLEPLRKADEQEQESQR